VTWGATKSGRGTALKGFLEGNRPGGVCAKRNTNHTMLWTRGLPYKEVQAGCDQCQKYCSNVIQRPATRQLQPMGRNSEKTDLSVYWIADLADLFKVGTYVCRGIHRSAVPGSFMFVTMTKSRHCQQHKMTDELTQGDVIFTMKRYPTDFASRWRKIAISPF
jgi:hypothetical protein